MKRALLAGLIVLLAAPLATAATIDAGTHVIAKAAGQTITVEVFTTALDPQPETMVSLNFFVSLVNGPDDSLKFTALDFEVTDLAYGNYMFYDGSDFAAPFFSNPWSGSDTKALGGAGAFPPPMGGAPYPIPGDEANPAGLALVTLDASSATLGGTWDFLLEIGGSMTNWVNGDRDPGPGVDPWGNSNPPILLAGSITVVPEPAVALQLLALVGMGGLGLFFTRRKNRVG